MYKGNTELIAKKTKNGHPILLETKRSTKNFLKVIQYGRQNFTEVNNI